MNNKDTIFSAWRRKAGNTIAGLIVGTALLLWTQPVAASKLYGPKLCKDPGYTCMTVKRGQSWASLFPDKYDREVVQRLNRMGTPLYKGMRIAVPVNLANTSLLDVSPFSTTITPPNRKTIIVDPNKLAFGAYDADGTLVHWGPISAGQNYCSDVKRRCQTITGTYTVYTKQGAGCKSKKYPLGKGGAPMPYCMFFHKGFALHGSPTVPGYHASHGCVRLYKDDAKWLNTQFVNVGSTRVIIKPY
jgi:L,D-transpeptidase ErfK/SrfK